MLINQYTNEPPKEEGLNIKDEESFRVVIVTEDETVNEIKFT